MLPYYYIKASLIKLMSKSKSLLPSGFYDLVEPNAKLHFDVTASICSFFENMGYKRATAPAIEFEESLFNFAGRALKSNTFRLMDPISHKMMGVRADMTVQIARIAQTRLKNEPKPLRLMYSGDVFRVKGKGLDSERQLTQAGLELIGKNNPIADAEIISISIEALENVGIKDLCLDLNLPSLSNILLNDLSKDERKNIINLINRKDLTEIDKFSFANKDIVISMLSGEVNQEQINSLKLQPEICKLFDRLFAVKKLLENKHPKLNITIDSLVNDRFNYHSGIGFSIFTKAAPFEIARGGRYNLDEFETAIGSTIYVNQLIKIIKPAKQKQQITVNFSDSKEKITQLQSQGYDVVYAL